MTSTTPVESLRPGARFLAHGVAVTLTRDPEPGVETVAPLAGRPCTRLWVVIAGRTSTGAHMPGAEGYVTYGPGATVDEVEG